MYTTDPINFCFWFPVVGLGLGLGLGLGIPVKVAYGYVTLLCCTTEAFYDRGSPLIL